MVADAGVPTILERVFLVGCPRSGTTLLQSMLMAHPRIESFPETKFFARGFGGRRRWVLHETLRGGYLWYLLARWLVENGYMDWGEVYTLPVSWSKDRMAEVFRDVLDRLARESGKDVWVEKTPRHLHFVDVICDHLPDAKFIHIVRDGRAVVASMYQLAHTNPETWGQYQSVERIVRRWNRCVRDSLQHVSEDHHAAVGYEQLVEAPERVLHALSSFLNVDYDSTMVEDFHREAQRVVKSHETWKADTMTSSSLKHRGLDKFHSVLSAERQEYVDEQLDWSGYRDLEHFLL